MDQSEFKTESACVCDKCCSAVFPFFSISNYEFKALSNINSGVDKNRYDEYVSLSKLSKLTANLKMIFLQCTLIQEIFQKTKIKLIIF